MAKTMSKMVPLHSMAPDFCLWEPLRNKERSLGQLKGDKGTLIIFMCNHCPFVVHIRKKLVEISQSYEKKGIHFIAINSNDAQNYPEDSAEKMVEYCEKYHYPFPYLLDETQEIARAYDATCTPDFFLYDKDLRLVYRGRFDASTPGNSTPVSGSDLLQALDAILENTSLSGEQHPSIGCNIKWRDVEKVG